MTSLSNVTHFKFPNLKVCLRVITRGIRPYQLDLDPVVFS
jgi:hypothetical protein